MPHTTTLTLTNVQPSQNGYRYRLVLSNAGCGAVNSNAATLTVNPLPTVSLGLSPAGQTQLRPGMRTTVTVSSSPAGASYQWFINGVAEPSITGSSYAVDAFHLGTYTVRVTDVNGCVSTTAGCNIYSVANKPTVHLSKSNKRCILCYLLYAAGKYTGYTCCDRYDGKKNS